jgi:hypothetical protein
MGGVIVGNSVADLGHPTVDGTPGIIEVATGRREHLFYNLAKAGWAGLPKVSITQVETFGMQGGLNMVTWGYPYTSEGDGNIDTAYGFHIHHVPDAQLFQQAGLRLQENLSGEMKRITAGEDSRLALTWYALDNGMAFLSPFPPNHGVALRTAPNGNSFRFFSGATGWQEQPEEVVFDNQHGYPEVYVLGSVAFRKVLAQYRWVSGGMSATAPEPVTNFPPLDPYILTWLRASKIPVAVGSPVETWPDYSARSWHLDQRTPSKRPVLMEESGERFVRFDGVNDWLGTIAAPETATGMSQPLAIFLVMRQRNTGGSTQVWAAPNVANQPLIYRDGNDVHVWAGGSSGDMIYNHGSWPSPWTIWSVELDGAGSSTWENKVLKVTGDAGHPGPIAFSSLRIGSNPAESFPAAIDVAEVVVVFRGITDAEREQMVDFLAAEHGIAV